MSVPYEFPFVQAEIGPRLKIVGSEQETREHSFKAVNDACLKIRAEKDDGWGLLIKTSGANAFGFAADIWLYNLRNGTAQVVDVVSNSEGYGGEMPAACWGEADIRPIEQWSLPMQPPFEPDDGGGDVVPPTDHTELAARVTALEEVVTTQGVELDELHVEINTLTDRITTVEAQLVNGLYAHGPVDLPIVLESLTSLRAKGDISVAVKPGQADPPTESDGATLSPKAFWIWLRRRGDDEPEGGDV